MAKKTTRDLTTVFQIPFKSSQAYATLPCEIYHEFGLGAVLLASCDMGKLGDCQQIHRYQCNVWTSDHVCMSYEAQYSHSPSRN